MKKILVTGSSGYIGSHLCKMLENDYEVHGVDIQEPKIEVPKFYKIDISRMFALNNGIIYDAVVHLAALVRAGESVERPISYYVTNLNGTMNVLNKIKTKNFVFASTGLAAKCNNPYAISKRAAEDVVRAYCKMAETTFTAFRFYNVIGSTVVPPTNPDGLFYKLMEALDTKQFTIYGDDYPTADGTCERDYVHVEEICHGIKLAIECPTNKVECLGHGIGYSVKQMVQLFQTVNNASIDVKIGPRRDGDDAYAVLDSVSPYMKNMFSLAEILLVK